MSGTTGTGTGGLHSSTSSSAVTASTNQILFSTIVGPSFLTSNSLPSSSVDDLHRLVNHYGQYHNNHPSSQLMMSSGLHPPPPPLPPPPSIGLNMLPAAANTGPLHQAAAFNLWDWNAMSEASKDYNNNPFK